MLSVELEVGRLSSCYWAPTTEGWGTDFLQMPKGDVDVPQNHSSGEEDILFGCQLHPEEFPPNISRLPFLLKIITLPFQKTSRSAKNHQINLHACTHTHRERHTHTLKQRGEAGSCGGTLTACMGTVHPLHSESTWT